MSRHNGTTLLEALVWLGSATIFSLVTAGVVAVARTDGRIDYCYVEASSIHGQAYRVVGHRPWRPDAEIGYASTPQEADKLLRESVICGSKP